MNKEQAYGVIRNKIGTLQSHEELDLQEALNELYEAIQDKPKEPEPRVYRVAVMEELIYAMGRASKAKKALTSAIDLWGHDDPATLKLEEHHKECVEYATEKFKWLVDDVMGVR